MAGVAVDFKITGSMDTFCPGQSNLSLIVHASEQFKAHAAGQRRHAATGTAAHLPVAGPFDRCLQRGLTAAAVKTTWLQGAGGAAAAAPTATPCKVSKVGARQTSQTSGTCCLLPQVRLWRQLTVLC